MKLPKRTTVAKYIADGHYRGLPALHPVHRPECSCNKCAVVRNNIAAVERKIYTLAQLGRTGAITARELTGEQEKVKGAGA
jgi:hypothetical protein